MKRILSLLVLCACLFSISIVAYADKNNKFEKLINDFDGQTLSKIEKKLGKDFVEYSNAISYKYVKYKDTNYYEITFFTNSSGEVTDIDFVVDNNGNQDSIDDLIFTFSGKYGEPRKFNPYTPADEYMTRYDFKNSDGDVIAIIRVYESKSEVDYYYIIDKEENYLNFYDLTNELDITAVKKLANSESAIKEDPLSNSGESLYYGDVDWLFDDLDGSFDDARFSFNEDNSLQSFRGYLVPNLYGSDVPNALMLNQVELMNFESLFGEIVTTLTEKFGAPTVEESDNRFSGGKDTQATWKAALSDDYYKTYAIRFNDQDAYKISVYCGIRPTE